MEPSLEEPTRILLFLSICNHIGKVLSIFKQHSHRWMLQRTASAVGHQSQVDASSKIRYFSRRSQIPSQLIECDRYSIGQQRRIIFERRNDVPVGYQTVQQTYQNEQDFSSKTNPSHKTHWLGPFSPQPLIKTTVTVNIKRFGPNKRRTT